MDIDLSSDDYTVHGEMGGGGGGAPQPHKPVEANDTLASRQSLRVMLAICEGPIASIDQIYVNGTPISGYSATYDGRLGTPDQTAIPGYPDVETPVGVGVQLQQGSPVTRAVTSSDVDAVRLTLRVNALQLQQDNGDIVGNSVELAIYTRPDALSNWTQVTSTVKSGKAGQPYSWDVRVNKPFGAGVWEIKVQRVTPDDANSRSVSTSYWDSFTELQDAPQNYPNTALLAITFTDSTELGGRAPEISCDITGRLVKIPHASYYNPVARTYTGNWTGAWALSDYPSDNPAWILYDVLTHDRVGLGIPETEIDKFSFYELAKYCDVYVDNGAGGTEPRFTLNNQFYVRENAQTFLAYLLAICNANLTTTNGLITVVSDRPTSPSKLVTNANVIDGLFDYSSADLSERFSSVNVTYNDPNDKGNTTTVTETDPVLLARYGLQSADIVLVGCTSAGQARRKARWVFETQARSTDVLTFKTGLAGMAYMIGEVIEVMDNDYANVLQQGLIKSATSNGVTTTIILDRSLALPDGTLNVMCYGADGVTLQDAIINQSDVTTSTLTTASPLASNPAANSPFIIKGAIIPRPWRVSSITADGHEHTIVCTAYDEGKYSRIDTGIVLPTLGNAFVNVDAFSVEPVVNISFAEVFRNDGIKASAKLIVKWGWDLDGSEKYKATFDVLWRRDNLPFKRIDDLTVKECEIPDATPGVYEVVIYAYNVRGIRSQPATQVYSYRTAAATSTLEPPIDFYVAGTVGTTFDSANLSVTWAHNPANDSKSDVLLDYVLEIWTSDGLSKKRTLTIQPNASKGGQYVYTYQQNADDFGTAQRTVQLKLYSRDVTGDVSIPVAANFSNATPAAPSYSLLSGVGITYVDITPPSGADDVVGYVIHRSTTAGFTPGPANIVYDGPDTYVSLGGEPGTTYYYRVAAYDSFGKTGLSYASQQSSMTLSLDVDTWTFDGLVFKPNDPGTNKVSWTAGHGHKTTNGVTTDYAIAAGNVTWTSGILYIYYEAGDATLSATTTLGIAVSGSSRILATYQGGTDLIMGNGNAFISGDKILAGTVGANQLVTGSAVITGSAQIAGLVVNAGHIQDGAIENAKIGNYIQSTTYNNLQGWKIDKGGSAVFNNITIRDGAGNVILSSGAGTDWNFLNNRPNDDEILNARVKRNTNLVPALINWTRSGIVWHRAAEGNSADGTSLVYPVSASTQLAQINLGNLAARGTTFTLSFRCANDGGNNQALVADLSPDTLPQTNFTITPGDHLYTTTWTSSHANMSNASLRIFNTSISYQLRVYDVKLEISGVYTPWNAYKGDLVSVNNPLTGANTTDYVDSGNTALLNALQQWGDIQGSGKPVDNATRNTGLFATLAGKLTKDNISTYIASAAIGRAYIGTAAIGAGQIGDLEVQTLKLAGNAVTVTVVATATGAVSIGTNWTTVLQASITVSGLGSGETIPILIEGDCWLITAQIASNNALFKTGQYNVRIYRSASVYSDKQLESWETTISHAAVDNVGNGTYTYYLQLQEVWRNDVIWPGGSLGTYRKLKLQAVKR